MFRRWRARNGGFDLHDGDAGDALSQVHDRRRRAQSCPPCLSWEQPRKVEDVHLKSKSAVVAYHCGGRRR
jgi:hypothetical protein